MNYRSLKNWKYELLKTEITNVGIIEDVTSMYFLLGNDGTLYIYHGYAWDGASGPAIDTENFMRGSLVHDCLCQMISEGYLDRKYRKRADEILREICLEDGMSKFRAWYYYNAVRIFGARSLNKKNYPEREVIEI